MFLRELKSKRTQSPADQSDGKEQSESEEDDCPSLEDESVEPIEFEVKHRPENEKGKFGSEWKGGKTGCSNEGIRGAAKSQCGSSNHESDDGEQRIVCQRSEQTAVY